MVTVANHRLIRLIRFISQISTHLIINKFYLILINDKIFFYVIGAKKIAQNKQHLIGDTEYLQPTTIDTPHKKKLLLILRSY